MMGSPFSHRHAKGDGKSLPTQTRLVSLGAHPLLSSFGKDPIQVAEVKYSCRRRGRNINDDHFMIPGR